MRVRLKSNAPFVKMTVDGIPITREWKWVPDTFVLREEIEVEKSEQSKVSEVPKVEHVPEKVVEETKKEPVKVEESKDVDSKKTFTSKLFGKKKHK